MRNRPSVWHFFILTFALSWALWIPAALTGQTSTEFPTVLLFMLGGFGPSVAAVWLIVRHEDRATRRDFWHRLIAFRRIGWGWHLLIAAFVPAIFALTYLIHRALGGAAPGMETLATVLAQPVALLPTVIIGILAGPLSEELGWRGYALDRLRGRWGLVRANLILAAVWWLWHLPLFFIRGTSQHNLGVGTVRFWLFAANILPLTFLMTRAYDANGRSILSAVLIHFWFNFVFGLVYPVPLQFDVIRVILMFAGVGGVLLATRREG